MGKIKNLRRDPLCSIEINCEKTQNSRNMNNAKYIW